MSDDGDLDPLDIFSSSLENLYDYQPVTIASAGSTFEYAYQTPNGESSSIKLMTPDTQASNWFLHASDIWASARYLADNIHRLGLQDFLASTTGNSQIQLLELGASAGLPGILITNLYSHVDVTVSDYPDELLIGTLTRNVRANTPGGSCRVVPFAWGSEPEPLFRTPKRLFDMIIAADTLWSSSTHELFIHSLQATLDRAPTARIHLIAGLHTGRYTIQSFLHAVVQAGFEVESATESQIKGLESRRWDPNFIGEEEIKERRRWLVWIILKWRQVKYME